MSNLYELEQIAIERKHEIDEKLGHDALVRQSHATAGDPSGSGRPAARARLGVLLIHLATRRNSSTGKGTEVMSLSMRTSAARPRSTFLQPRLPARLWRSGVFLRLMERMAGRLLGMGDVTLHGIAPNGQLTLLMPKRVFFITDSHAELEGESLGHPVRGRGNPLIGSMALPARPTFAIGEAYFQILDQEEYKRTASEASQDARQDRRAKENRLGHIA